MDLYLEFTVIHKVNDRTYRLSMPYGSPYPEVLESLDAFKSAVLEIEDRAKNAAQQQADKEKGAATAAAAGV